MSAAEAVLPADAAAVRRVFRNALALTLAYALPRVLTLGAVVLAARSLGAARFGAYGMAGAAAVILSIVSTAGMQPLLVRELTHHRAGTRALMREAHGIKTALNALMLSLLWLASTYVFGLHGEALLAAMLLGCGYAIGSYAENLAAYFQAVERMHVWTAANAAYGIVTGTLGAAFIILTGSLAWFCGAMIVGQLAALVWLQVTFAREPVPHGSGAAHHQPVLRRAVLPFAAAFFALTVFCKADVLVLSRLHQDAVVGIYTAAYKLVDVAQALALATIVATYPRLTRAAVQRGVAERWAATRLAELALLVVTPLAATAFLMRHAVVTQLFGEGYAAAALPAGFLALAVIPLALNLLAGYILAATDRMRTMAALYGGMAILKLTLVAVLGGRYGAAGAAAAMAGSELMLCLALLTVLHRALHAAPHGRVLAIASLVVTCALGAALLPLGPAPLRVFVFLLAVGAVYGACDVLPAHERDTLHAAFRPGRTVSL